MIRSVLINSEQDLELSWVDERVPNMSNCFIEKSLDECAQVLGGGYTASYYPYIVEEDTEIIYLEVVENEFGKMLGGPTTIVITPGIYLLHPNDTQ